MQRHWYPTPGGWRYVDRSPVGVGIDATTAAAAAILPGGLPLLALYEAYEKLTGGAPPDTSAATSQLALVQSQIATSLGSCSQSAQASYQAQLAAASAAFTNAQQAYAASPSDAAKKNVLDAVQDLQKLAAAMVADAGCSVKPILGRVLCDDGTFAPDAKQCPIPWQTYALWGGVGIGALLVFAVVAKAVSD